VDHDLVRYNIGSDRRRNRARRLRELLPYWIEKIAWFTHDDPVGREARAAWLTDVGYMRCNPT